MPWPTNGEDHDRFVARCMASSAMQAEAPDQEQRYAICEAHWKEGPKAASLGFEPSPYAMILRSAGPALPIGTTRAEGGQPVRRFRKELIRVGQFTKEATDQKFEVSLAHLNHWAETFGRMRAAGVKVPVPAGHTADPERNRGYLIDCFRDGDRLIGILDLIGQDGIALAGRSDVSIYAEPSWKDGAGNTYEWPILHVALVTDPVIPGLAGFEPLAASLKGQKPVVLMLENQAMPDVAVTTPTSSAPAGSDPVDAVLNSVIDQVTVLIKDDQMPFQQKITEIKDILKKLERVKEMLGGGTAEAAPAEAAPAEGKGAGAVPVAASHSPMLLQLASKSRRQDLDNLVRDGKITPAVRAKLLKQWGEGEALALSLNSHGIAQFDALVAALAENDPVKLGEQTGPQMRSMVLSHGLSGESDAAAKKIQAETLANVKRMAGMK